MRLHKALGVAAIVTATVVMTATPSWAADGPGGSGSGSLGPGGIGAGAGAPGGTDAPAPVSYTPAPPNAAPSTQSGYVWTNVGSDLLFTCTNGQPTAIPPPVGPNGPGTGMSLGPPGAAGFPNLYELVGPNGNVIATQDVCPGQPAAPAPPPPPPPPTPAEVWAQTPLPTPTVNFDPSTLGLTQLPTWFWLTGVDAQVTATVTIRGYTVVTTAHPADYYWYFGDGAGATSASPGTQAAPSVTHTYVTKARYNVKVIMGWSGQYTFTGNGVAAQTVPLGTVDGPADTAAYGVQEVRSVGVAG